MQFCLRGGVSLTTAAMVSTQKLYMHCVYDMVWC